MSPMVQSCRSCFLVPWSASAPGWSRAGEWRDAVKELYLAQRGFSRNGCHLAQTTAFFMIFVSARDKPWQKPWIYGQLSATISLSGKLGTNKNLAYHQRVIQFFPERKCCSRAKAHRAKENVSVGETPAAYALHQALSKARSLIWPNPIDSNGMLSICGN